MILIVTNKEDYTADFLILALIERKIKFARLNTEDYPTKINVSLYYDKTDLRGLIELPKKQIAIHEITSIWYRRPKPSVSAPEVTDEAAKEFIVKESSEFLQGLWRVFDCFWMSHPDRLRVAESKIYQLSLATKIGFNIPHTLITNSPHEAKQFYLSSSEPYIYKPLRHSQIKRNEKTNIIFTSIVQEQAYSRFDNIKYAPTLLQINIKKDFELRVTVVGHLIFTLAIYSQEHPEAQIDWRRAEFSQLKYEVFNLPEAIKKQCLSLVQALGLSFGAIDLIVTPEGDYVFLEINPNGQWAWLQQLCPDLEIREAIIQLLLARGEI